MSKKKRLSLLVSVLIMIMMSLSSIKVDALYTPPKAGDANMSEELSVDFTVHIIDVNGDPVENVDVLINDTVYSDKNNQGTLTQETINIEILKPTHHHIIKSVYYVVGSENFEKKTDRGIGNVKDDIVMTITIQKDKQIDENIDFVIGQYDAIFYLNYGSGKATLYLNDEVIETIDFKLDKKSRFTTNLQHKIQEHDTFTVVIDNSETVTVEAKENTRINRIIRPTIGDKVLIGEGVVGWTLRVYRNNEAPVERIINEQGRWLIELDEPLKRQENIYYEFINKDGFAWEGGNFTVERPLNESLPTINTHYAKDIQLSGTAEESRFVDLFISNHSYYRSFVDEHGNWSITLDTPLEENDILYLYTYDDIEERTLMWEGRVEKEVIIDEVPPVIEEEEPPIDKDETEKTETEEDETEKEPPIVNDELEETEEADPKNKDETEEEIPVVKDELEESEKEDPTVKEETEEEPPLIENDLSEDLPTPKEKTDKAPKSDNTKDNTVDDAVKETLPQTGAMDYRSIAGLFILLAIMSRLKYRNSMK